MARAVLVRPRAYYDSVTLMQLAARLNALPGVQAAQAFMGTPANRDLLGAGAADPEVAAAGPGDMVVAVTGESAAACAAALAQVDALLGTPAAAPTGAPGAGAAPRSIAAAATRLSAANLAVVAVPGAHAARAARQALAAGMHVLLFSDNVPVADEVALKAAATEQGLLVMGPDCGTAYLGGTALGFCNVVSRGPVGIVGASGTGTQEAMCLLDRLGSGVSAAIGTGGRDLSAAVGAATTRAAIRLLAADPDTGAILLISKPPDPTVAAVVMDDLAAAGKPAVACFVGKGALPPPPPGVQVTRSLEAAAELAAGVPSGTLAIGFDAPALATGAAALLRPGQDQVLGLFSGGTLAHEAAAALATAGVPHRVLDLGDDQYTVGRPHPMIDPALRAQLTARDAAAPAVAVLLLDVVLGHAAHPDPAGALVPAIRAAQAAHAAARRHLAVVASVTGTDADPQVRRLQVQALGLAGAQVAPTNRQAALLAAAIARRGGMQA